MGKLSSCGKGQAFVEYLPLMDQTQHSKRRFATYNPHPLTIPTRKVKNLKPGVLGGMSCPRPESGKWRSWVCTLSLEPQAFPCTLLPQPGLPQSLSEGWPSALFWDILDTPTHSCVKVFPGPQEWLMTASSSNVQQRSALWVVAFFQTRREGSELLCVIPRML